GHEEAGVAHFQAELIADSARSFRTDVLGDRAGTAFLALAPEDVTKARLALALRPGVHAVAEGAAAAAGSGHRPDADLRVFLDHAGEDLEARATEVLGHILHLDRVAQVRLVGAVLADRLLVRDAREHGRDRLALAELLEHAADDRLHGLEHVLLLDEAHLHV